VESTAPDELLGPGDDGESEPPPWARLSEVIETSVPCFGSKIVGKPFSDSRDIWSVSRDTAAFGFLARADRIADRKEGSDGWGWDCETVGLESVNELSSKSPVVDVFAKDSELGGREFFSRGMSPPSCQPDSVRCIDWKLDSVAVTGTHEFLELPEFSGNSENSDSDCEGPNKVLGDSESGLPLVFLKRSAKAGTNSELESSRGLTLGSTTRLLNTAFLA
jgi:hypothetical protein